MEVETASYDDNGKVEAETIITLDDTELIVVQSEHIDEHQVWERDIGETQPHSRLDNNE